MDATRVTARRAALTARRIAAQPQRITIRRGATDRGPYTVALQRVGTRGSHEQSSEASRDRQADITITGAAGLDIRRGDRVRTADGAIYLVTFVAPNQGGRVDADAITEQ